MFGFVRFIKVFDVEHLVNNICTMWIGRHKIHANVARFQRASLNNSSNQFRYNGDNGNNINDVSKDKRIKESANSYAHVVKGPQLVNVEVASIDASAAIIYSPYVEDIAVVLCLALFQSTTPPLTPRTDPVLVDPWVATSSCLGQHLNFKGFSSMNYVRKFLRALHHKWRAYVTVIEESKDLSSLALDDLICNLKVHEVVMEKDSEIYRGKKERVKSIALKAKKESSDDETLTPRSGDKEYAMAVRNFKKFFRRKGKFVRQPREEKKSFQQRDKKKEKSNRKCFRCSDPNHLIGDFLKKSRNKDQKAFIGGSWSNNENDAEDKTNDE
nr:zf-CCHC domain-containing protein/UBN2 domain-containing protein [Tanacetum cinerariifolium]